MIERLLTPVHRKNVGASLEESEADYQSALVEQFQKSIHKIKADREMRSRYMLFEEMMKDEFKDGKAEGKVERKARQSTS